MDRYGGGGPGMGPGMGGRGGGGMGMGGGSSMGGGGMGGRGGMGGGGGGPGFVSRSSVVKALKESVQTGHRTGLPPKLVDLFAAREAPPIGTAIKKKKPALPYTGVAALVTNFAAPGDEEYEPAPPTDRPPSPRKWRNRELATQIRLDRETRIEKKERIAQWKKEEGLRKAEEAARTWDPAKDPLIEGDPFKTIIVSRLSYEATEKKLRKEFEEFGTIKRIRVVHDKNTGKHRGYAFVEFEHKNEMKEAYKMADGRKIEDKRVSVDVERGRTVENWKPRRLGGGLGGEGRNAKLPKKAALAAAGGIPPAMVPYGGADRGAYRPPPRDDRPPPRDDFRPPVRDERVRDRPRSPPRMRTPPRIRGAVDDDRRREDDRRRGEDDRRKREREASPRRDRDRDDKRVRHLEEGEVRDERGGRVDRGDRGRDEERRRRERDLV